MENLAIILLVLSFRQTLGIYFSALKAVSDLLVLPFCMPATNLPQYSCVAGCQAVFAKLTSLGRHKLSCIHVQHTRKRSRDIQLSGLQAQHPTQSNLSPLSPRVSLLIYLNQNLFIYFAFTMYFTTRKMLKRGLLLLVHINWHLWMAL